MRYENTGKNLSKSMKNAVRSPNGLLVRNLRTLCPSRTDSQSAPFGQIAFNGYWLWVIGY